MLIKRKILRLACSPFLIGAIFLSSGCEEPQPLSGNQPKSIVAENASVNKSRNTNANAVSSNTNSEENASNSQPETNSAGNVSNSQFDPSNKSSADDKFTQAAAQNAQLKSNLQWTFGGKAQTGWYIYETMIANTIETDGRADSTEFAAALSRWQKKFGLAPNGVLDLPTLNAIIAKWQTNRLKVRGFASPDELTVGQTIDFYDPSRAEELRQIERNTYAAYKKIIAAAIADKSLELKADGKGNLAPSEKFLKIVSAFRPKEYQEKLQRESPNSGRAGLATNSPHFTGRAIDVYVGGDPVDTKDANRAIQVQTPVYKWLVKNAAKFGFKPYFYEPWHWEYAPD